MPQIARSMIQWCIWRERMGLCEMTVKCTRLCYWIARPAKPGVQSSNTSRVRFTVISHTPMCSWFYHTHFTCKWNWDDFCLVNLIYFALHIFQIRNLLHCVDEPWWNMPFKQTWRCGGRCCCYVVTIVTECSSIMMSRSLNTYCDITHEWVMNIHYKTWTAQGRFTNMILTPSNQWGVCDNVLNHSMRNKCYMSEMTYPKWLNAWQNCVCPRWLKPCMSKSMRKLCVPNHAWQSFGRHKWPGSRQSMTQCENWQLRI